MENLTSHSSLSTGGLPQVVSPQTALSEWVDASFTLVFTLVRSKLNLTLGFSTANLSKWVEASFTLVRDKPYSYLLMLRGRVYKWGPTRPLDQI